MARPAADSPSEPKSMRVRQPSEGPAGLLRFQPERVHWLCLNGARIVLLFSLLYVTWRFGGTDPITLLHASLMLAVVCVLALFAHPGCGTRARSMPLLLLLLTAAAIIWPLLQLVPLSSSLMESVAGGSVEVNHSLVDNTYRATDSLLGEPTATATGTAFDRGPPRRSISVVTSLTQFRIVQWTLTAAFLFLAAFLFDSRGSRVAFLWTIAINAGCLSVWGIIQRSTGTTELLPGFARPTVVLPFATFVYKNAGAAALIPGLAAATALLWAIGLPPLGKSRRRSRGSQPAREVAENSNLPAETHHRPSFWLGRRRARHGYAASPLWCQPRVASLLLLIGLIAAGLLVSYSRGAWIATTLALVAVLAAARRYLSLRWTILTVGIPLVIGTGIVVFSSSPSALTKRIERLSAGELVSDTRWQHWENGLRAGMKHLPVGSGLGTYGYAAVAEQRVNSKLWFREAHNQYLETLTEQGIPGILIAGFAVALVLKYAAGLLTNQYSRQHSAIGFAGLFTTLAIAIQSTVDFVILIPGVMFLVASMVGIVSQTYLSNRRFDSLSRARPGQRVETGWMRRWPSVPAAWLAVLFVSLMVTWVKLRDRLYVDRVLEETRLSIAQDQPTDQFVGANLRRLESCIERQPNRADVFHRRAQWHLAEFRLALQDVSAKSGVEMTWASTSPESLFQRLMSLPEEQRESIVGRIAAAPELSRPLKEAVADIQTSVAHNPFVPQVHLLAAMIAPAVAVDHQPFAENLCRLSHSNPRLQFAAGLIGYHTGDTELMLDQWRQCLRGYTPELPEITRLCRESLSLRTVMADLIPDDRTVLFLPLIRSLDEQDIVQLAADPEVTGILEKRIKSDSTRTAGQQHSLLGWIWTELYEPIHCVRHWKAAVKADRTNADYRFQYCQVLLRTGEYEEVLRQASLGQSLDRDRKRFKKVADAARRKLRVGTRWRAKSSRL